MTGVKCKGDESTIQQCLNDGKVLAACGDPSRSVTPYAGVICTECKYVTYLLKTVVSAVVVID